MAARTTTADNCRVHDAIEFALYRPPPWTAAYALRVWKLAFHRLEHDPALLSLPRDARRRMRGALWALFEKRNYGTGYCDAHLEALEKPSGYKRSSLKVGLNDLWRHRLIRRIPRKVYDPDHRPKGWRAWGAYRQATDEIDKTLLRPIGYPPLARVTARRRAGPGGASPAAQPYRRSSFAAPVRPPFGRAGCQWLTACS